MAPEPGHGPPPSWTYTAPDSGDELGVHDTCDGQQALWSPRYAGDPQPYCDEGSTGRRYRPDQVGTGFSGAREAGLAAAFAQFTDIPQKGTSMSTDTGLTADGSTDEMAAALQQAGDELESIAIDNNQLADAFEQNGWSGMDALGGARDRIASVRESLTDVAHKIGVGGAAVRDARLNNQMATHATEQSLGRT